MNDEKLHELEARLAILERRDRRRESEHTGQLRTKLEIEQRLNDQMTRDYELLSRASDERLAELLSSITRKPGTDDDQHEAEFAVDIAAFVTGVLAVFDAITERQRRIEGTVREMAVTVNAGTQNERTFAAGLAELGQRVVAVENSVSTVDQIAKDFRGMHAKIEELYERFSAGRANRPKGPSSN